MEFRLPEPSDEEMLASYVQEHLQCGETFIHASLGLADMDYATWCAMVARNATEGFERWGRTLTELCLAEGRLVGLVGIRYELPPDLSARYGDIGYGVRPSERRRGHGTEILRHALAVARVRGLTQVTLGCYRDNLASAATIRKCGGTFLCENDDMEPGRPCRYFTIRL